MDVVSAISERRSVRSFTSEGVSDELLEAVLEAGRWAPSGLNNQPWRFKVIRDTVVKGKLAELTRYGEVILAAPVSVAVFLDMDSSYDRTKDLMAVGACIQNMLLSAHSLGLGGVWLGEILKNKEKAEGILSTPRSCELVAVVSLGHPAGGREESERKPISNLLL